jgi:hypothetical protein
MASEASGVCFCTLRDLAAHLKHSFGYRRLDFNNLVDSLGIRTISAKGRGSRTILGVVTEHDAQRIMTEFYRRKGNTVLRKCRKEWDPGFKSRAEYVRQWRLKRKAAGRL